MPISVRPRAIDILLDSRLSRLESLCREAGVPFYDDAGVDSHLDRVLLASDYAYESFVQDPQLLGPELVRLMNDPRHADARVAPFSSSLPDSEFRSELRRFRRRESIRLIWRDVNNVDKVETTLTGASVLAEVCLEAALRHAERQLVERHGNVRAASGEIQRLVVLALGKLGGGELNFSSDVDLVLAYDEPGASDGARPLDAEIWYSRLSQHLISLLADRTPDGYVYRVDLRLRPFGNVGRVALSFSAMEQYYQREGRDWERYAWIKARPVAGDKAAGARLLATLRPFVFRRYFDYTAFAGLREMKGLIDAEVARKDLAEHLKLGPGGIREIEFIVQLMQLIRGGRESALRVRGLLSALSACEQLGLISAKRARALGDAYRLLRRVENRVQMFADQQTHELPADESQRTRIALALGHADSAALNAELDRHRAAVSEEFNNLMAPARRARSSESTAEWNAVWARCVGEGVHAEAFADAGFDPVEPVVAALEGLIGSPILRAASVRSRERIDRVMPALFAAAAESAAPGACLVRLIGLVHAVARRSAYLALLDEQPAALKRLTAVFAASALLAERVIAYPLLLDELFDERSEGLPPGRDEVEAEMLRRLASMHDHDLEREIELVQEQRLAAVFRLGLAFLGKRIDAVRVARNLADVAEAVLGTVLRIAERDLVAAHGRIGDRPGEGAAMAVIGYGSLGGIELGFGSDLDLVFVYDSSHAHLESDGEKPLEGARYYARLAQRFVHLLTMLTRSGRLYEIDVRLRPDGGKGVLVTTLDAYAAYQHERAWTWEHQALVRARAVAGDVNVCRRFAETRAAALEARVDANELRRQIVDMRSRWRRESDRSDEQMLDLKQGLGALVDIEFLMQALVLEHASACPRLLTVTNTVDLIETAEQGGLLDASQSTGLRDAHTHILGRSLAATLDARPRVVLRDAEVEQSARDVLRIARELDLAFD
ncbi:MAG TPA: bifunctional [glutamate--ammonia ligase]-adenylyl-L-tyrosine phosphorylase/[glutamate--ammonia-ligase] adenylyltransferase [Dokdonella sp.]|uniref:bifunctional [glutamate--ammonia ligase]-adenylyl-L-tyrosine phosphorylase/[glutamate--ammonia-ligase] adenylyltransferase n=1 Tax=Dokdonella sp. TaxID=2291710 RepID=UPI002CAA2B4D|nr:bifunctional [glutamate--ammonia ligase]-adenylyl-L-tyrosine phosphorylase/[glutamate--ammonia-ligase] adenylyltransferase [Dokdonella sp.]HOX70540.1 bifunctional [glutamate--ammonia ligase]-adenylyl-L-tyrosine phosphorylase/[glutamate--ammonia-ligase] adenylyltransferase [Dokdonella sp.]HPG94236.1 bifunctional [glutamate--ammonia ligase]-adenylyl-L-tyrosine phosphorylase/[glutamate--ammonia-ligase] adenylyltransferase [Dokdonella sp.]HPN79372.1 bifunctional [glutamate--ammonia ligase]-adenyl